jgi:glucose-1-phosphate cytidylyltransferase
MIFNRQVFEYFGGDDCILEQDPMQRWVAEKQLMVYRHDDFFFAMDTYRKYKYLNELWEEGKAPWKVEEWVSFAAGFSPHPTEV